ncbi:hypothetical protein YC2023_026173 [Brassica napus]
MDEATLVLAKRIETNGPALCSDLYTNSEPSLWSKSISRDGDPNFNVGQFFAYHNQTSDGSGIRIILRYSDPNPYPVDP